MFIGKKRPTTSEQASQQARQLKIAYKTFFTSDAGKEVLCDLMNRFHAINPHDGSPRCEGQRSVICHILAESKVDLAQFDRILNGDFSPVSAIT